MTYFFKYIIQYWRLGLIIIFLLLTTSIASLATPYALKIIIDDIFPKGNFSDLVKVLMALVGIYIIRIFSSLLSEIFYTKLGESISRDIRVEMFRSLLLKPISFFNNLKIGDVVFTLIEDVDNVQRSLSNLVLVLMSNIFTFIGIVVMLFYLNTELAVYSILFIPALLLLLKKFTPLVKKSFKEARDLESSIQNYFIVIIKNIRVVKSYNTIQYEIKKLSGIHEKFIDKVMTYSRYKSINSNSSTFIIALAPILVLIVGGHKVFEKEMTLGVLIAFIQYLNRIFAPSTTIVNSYNQLVSSSISAEKIQVFFDDLKLGLGNISENYPVKDIEIQHIYLKNISLVINNKVILKDLTLQFENGKTYSILGPSGSGKSSIINLLTRLIEPTSGEILVNGLNLNQISDWNSYFALIERDNQIFNESVSDNIKYGTKEENKDIDLALSLSHLNDIITEMSQGKDTILSHTGNSLSDGQKQRISIARAIYRSPKIFIFDEATSSLDIALEKKIIDNIRNHHPDSIIIIVSHRKETTILSDYIIHL
ncbi:ABC transporter ATP-binding protein/permease [Chryseobacterium sp. MEBOG06]|uniref:ABC transporter ATP-binding protein n=1 Tax=Chryseobacterium sp. MEBOG06 TaxID=2879938 RepID=UPI001F20DE6D|nr:ABC transporter ATP-binding protein [Chryseobacterium sp. MEBOG06]UKB84725.1 ABC transporter ATP-binding protein/permease [Chryseobacterium sp. MEBOG06]